MENLSWSGFFFFRDHWPVAWTSPICQEGQSERTFRIFPLFPNFSLFSQFFPLLPNFWQIFAARRGQGHSAPLTPSPTPVATPLFMALGGKALQFS